MTIQDQASADLKRRILVVEDENIVAMDICQGLERLGHEVIGVTNNGKSAIALAESVRPDLILMDIQIKGDIDGIETSKEIWNRLQIPVIFLTAYADSSTLERAKATEPFGYILKPFEERELHTAIEVVLSKHRAVQAEHRKQIEALRQSEEIFHLLVNSVKDYAIIMLDTEGAIATWNAGAERIYGYREQEILGKHFSALLPKESKRSQVLDIGFKCALEDGRYEEEAFRARKTGEPYWASVITYPLWGPDKKLRGFAKITRDISERKKAEDERNDLLERLKNAVKMRDEFISIASHELKTPVTSIKLQSDALDRLMEKVGAESIDPERIRKLIKTNKQQSQRLTRLVDDMLDLTRINSGKLDIKREPIDLQQTVAELVDRFRGQLAQTQSPIDVQIDPGIRGYWDRIRFEQVVDNLLSNAIKYGSGKPIRLKALSRGGRVTLTVQDHGIGIPEEAHERIFNRFERAVPVTHISGFGLGLYIAKRIIAAHGGKIWVRSEPGKGATFVVELPLGQEPSRTAHA